MGYAVAGLRRIGNNIEWTPSSIYNPGMTREALLSSILCLTPEERLSLIDDIWDSLSDRGGDWPPLSDSQRAELDRRLDEVEKNPGAGKSWEEVEAAALARLSGK